MSQTTSRKEMLERAIKSALKGEKALSRNGQPCRCVEITGQIHFTSHEPAVYDATCMDQWTEIKGVATATIHYQNNVYEPSVEIEFAAKISNCTVISIVEPIRADFEIPVIL